MFTKITNDLFRIAERLKQINPKYVVFRNTAAHRFEVHNNSRATNACNNTVALRPCTMSLEFVIPFNELDSRTLEYARVTRIENFDVIEAEQAASNMEIEKSAKQSIEQSTAIFGDMMEYAGNQVHEVVFKKNKKWW